MTPEEAQYLEPGTTPGPWEAYDPGDGTARMYAGEGEEARPLLHNVDSDPHTACVYVTREDGNLIAAAPDLAQTIAEMTEEWRCEANFNGTWAGLTTWESSPDYARATMQRSHRYPTRLVRRLVGPVEVAE